VCLVVNLYAPPTAKLKRSLIATAALAGSSSFGGEVTLETTDIECAAIDLDAEQYAGLAAVFLYRGGNRCRLIVATVGTVAATVRATYSGRRT
jgi:hypothetical protein